jgi:XRE family transcriptional regulator, aerobic/anaerobic benzoate catabolism transcriptional regulator
MSARTAELQQRLGRRVRQRRNERGLTLEQLAGRSTVSSRFVSEVESGRANISIARLLSLADALELPLTQLLAPPASGPRAAIDLLLDDASDAELERARRLLEVALGRVRPPIIALLGVRGAGKSTVGIALADTLGLPFVELDGCIEACAGMPLADIFTLHGEDLYRRLELSCLTEQIERNERVVLALPGGIVGSDAARTLLASACTTVWLRASPEDHWARVFAQGDTRPMAGRDNAMAELRALLARREPLYAASTLTADTSAAPPDAVVASLAAELDSRGLVP